MSSIQQQEQTINDLDNYEIGYMPHYKLFIGEERFDYELSEYNLLTEQVSTIYKNINEYKDKKIEIGFEYGTGSYDYDTITIIQECKNCNEDICCCEKCEKCEKFEEDCDCDFTDSEEEEEQTLNCETCKIDIIRDSEEHNNCIIDNSGEKIYCRNCVEEEIRNIDTVD